MRNFPINAALREILWGCKQDSGYVVSVNDGEPLTCGRFRRAWEKIGKQINLYGMTPRNFRTTFASMAVAAGVDIRTTQSLMGHSTPEMTLKIYTKQVEGQLSGAMEKLDNFLSE